MFIFWQVQTIWVIASDDKVKFSGVLFSFSLFSCGVVTRPSRVWSPARVRLLAVKADQTNGWIDRRNMSKIGLRMGAISSWDCPEATCPFSFFFLHSVRFVCVLLLGVYGTSIVGTEWKVTPVDGVLGRGVRRWSSPRMWASQSGESSLPNHRPRQRAIRPVPGPSERGYGFPRWGETLHPWQEFNWTWKYYTGTLFCVSVGTLGAKAH